MSAQPAEGSEDALRVAAALVGAAGLLHARAGLEHGGEGWSHVVFFALVTYAQLGWAAAIWRGRRDRWLVPTALVGSVAIVATWLLTRTVGAPGDGSWEVEPLGVSDVVATVDELATVALLAALRWPDGALGRLLSWVRGPQAVRLGVMLCSASLLALAVGGHSH